MLDRKCWSSLSRRCLVSGMRATYGWWWYSDIDLHHPTYEHACVERMVESCTLDSDERSCEADLPYKHSKVLDWASALRGDLWDSLELRFASPVTTVADHLQPGTQLLQKLHPLKEHPKHEFALCEREQPHYWNGNAPCIRTDEAWEMEVLCSWGCLDERWQERQKDVFLIAQSFLANNQS